MRFCSHTRSNNSGLTWVAGTTTSTSQIINLPNFCDSPLNPPPPPLLLLMCCTKYVMPLAMRRPSYHNSPYTSGGGVSGHCLIWASGMLPPKLRHILGSFAFSEKISAKKCTLRRSNHFLKIQWEIYFVKYLNIERDSCQNKLWIEIWTFSL